MNAERRAVRWLLVSVGLSLIGWPLAQAAPQAVVARETHVLWSTKLVGPGLVRPTAPVAAGDLVFIAGDDGAVRALDTATGERRWKMYTGGEVRLPPTICDGRDEEDPAHVFR